MAAVTETQEQRATTLLPHSHLAHNLLTHLVMYELVEIILVKRLNYHQHERMGRLIQASIKANRPRCLDPLHDSFEVLLLAVPPVLVPVVPLTCWSNGDSNVNILCENITKYRIQYSQEIHYMNCSVVCTILI